MKYKFNKHKWDSDTVFGIECEKQILNNLSNSWDWSPAKVQFIIDGINTSKTKPKGEEYIWANEDITVLCNINGVFLLDMLAQRAKITEPEKLGLQLTHDEFLVFLNDFKKFVEENS